MEAAALTGDAPVAAVSAHSGGDRDDDELTLTCHSCGHAWPARLPCRVTLEQWVAVQDVA